MDRVAFYEPPLLLDYEPRMFTVLAVSPIGEVACGRMKLGELVSYEAPWEGCLGSNAVWLPFPGRLTDRCRPPSNCVSVTECSGTITRPVIEPMCFGGATCIA